jgi:competence CoiA-like predicted nuclease
MILSMGAFRKGTLDYISPTNANKIEKYECPDCRKDVIFRKGSVRIPHFAHMKEDDPCHYVEKPSESQLHKDAKMLLQTTLKTHDQINCSFEM